MITGDVQILLIEDNDEDALLIKRQIRKIVEAPNFMTAKTLDEFKRAIKFFPPDIIISDYNMKTFTGLEVLRQAQVQCPDIPFVFVTGTLHDEELAANTILGGASGFILKKHMSVLHERLLPFFTKRISPSVQLEETSPDKLIDQINRFLESSQSKSYDSLIKIREELDKVREEKA